VKKRKQLWMPYQVGFEFFENRIGIISKQLNQYDNLLKYLDTTKDNIANLNNSSPNHAHLDFAQIAQKYEKAVKPLKNNVEKLKSAHPDHLGDDKVLSRLEELFDDEIVGQLYDDKQLEEIAKQGEDRYEKKIPPGYKDQDKKEDENAPSRNRKYGDLIIWKQMIEKAKESGKPLIFITNDAKDDWVLYAKDHRKLGAKPLLKKEMIAEASVDFALYSSDEFLDIAHKQFNMSVKPQSVQEVKKFRELEVERLSSAQKYNPFMRQIQSFSKQPNLYLDQLHEFTHRARALSRECLHQYEKRELPAAAEENLVRLAHMYDDIHRLVDRSPNAFIAEIFQIEKMLMRCNHMLRDLERLEIPEVSELRHITGRMLDILEDSNI